MRISEEILFRLARLLYNTEVAHSSEMKQALSDRGHYADFRSEQVDAVMDAARRCGVQIPGRIVLDLGCSDGAMTSGYLDRGADKVIGVDIDAAAIRMARHRCRSSRASFVESTVGSLPLTSEVVDVVICYDVFEHVAQPATVLEECFRVLRPGGKMLIGTWGWYHPFAPHLWSTMPVPWAHVFFSERTVLRTCRRVYNAPWYVPTMHDLDADGRMRPGRYEHEEISTDYLNKLLIRDYEALFRVSRFRFKVFPQPFGSRLAAWTKAFLRMPVLREFVTSYIWVVLTKPGDVSRSSAVASRDRRPIRRSRG